MAIGIDPTVDFAFKRVFGSPEHPEVTLHFLNAVLSDGPRITSVEILNPILEKDSTEDKFAYLDILARDEHGRRLNIEMQSTLPAGMSERLTFYASRLFTRQFQSGDDYSRSNGVICICVLDAILFPEQLAYHLDFRLRDPRGVTLTNDLQIHLLELPKYTPPGNNAEVVGALEKWLYFLCNAESLSADEVSARLTEEEFAVAAGVLEMIARTPDERDFYDSREKARRDEMARMRGATQQGLEQGRVVGEKVGQVRTLQEFLDLPQTPSEALSLLDLSQLDRLVAELRQQLRAQRGR